MISPVRWVVKIGEHYYCHVDTDVEDGKGAEVIRCTQRVEGLVRFFRSLAAARRACRRVRRIEKRRGRDPEAVRVVALWNKGLSAQQRKAIRALLRAVQVAGGAR